MGKGRETDEEEKQTREGKADRGRTKEEEDK